MLALALLMDAIFGEPDWLWRRVPHPAVLMGRLVSWLEARLLDRPAPPQTPPRKRGGASIDATISAPSLRSGVGFAKLRGILAVVILVAVTLLLTLPLTHPVFHGVFEVLGAAVLLAQRSLAQHVTAVAAGLRESLAEGRRRVSLIVGRDPETLDEGGVARAAIESAAENWSDGVFVPAFWFLIAGLPGIAVYKAVNTADSMIGHRNERYREFGWAAARLDDVLNFIPARLAGALICLVGGRRPAFNIMLRDAGKHKSVNAGWPETAVAASLGVALAGPRVYGGVPTDDPFLNADGRVPGSSDIEDAVTLTWMAWGALLAFALLLTLVGAFDF